MTQKFVVRELSAEIERLKQELAWARNQAGGVFVPSERWDTIQGQLEDGNRELKILQEEVANSTKSLLETREANADLTRHLSTQESIATDLKEQLETQSGELEVMKESLIGSQKVAVQESM